jgi:hypothetical protein
VTEGPPQGRGPEGRPSPEHEPPYLRAARFAGEQPAGAAYEQARALLYRRRDLDLSTFRFQLDQVYHVAVLGLAPPEAVAQTIDQILAAGEPARLPETVVQLLARRRAEESRRGPWVERRYRPGKRL